MGIDIKAITSRYFSSTNVTIRFCIGLVVVLLFVANYAWNEPLTFFKRLELQAYDTRLRATMPATPDPRIVIIDIDEKTLAAEGRWPLSRDKWVLLLHQLFEVYKLKVVGFDVFFAEPDSSSGLAKMEALAQSSLKANSDFQRQLPALRKELDFDRLFADEIRKYPVVLAFAAGSPKPGQEKLGLGELPAPTVTIVDAEHQGFTSLAIDGYSANLKAFQESATATGHIIPHIDFDGVVRRLRMFIRYGDNYYESLSMAIFRTYLDNEPLRITFREDEGDGIKRIDTISIGAKMKAHVDDDNALLLPYRGESPQYRYISATDVMRGKLQPGELEGKIGLVGTSAQGLLDLRNTPVGEVYPGVETHATMLSGYLDNNFKRKPPFELTIKVLFVLLIGLPLVVLLSKSTPLWATIITATTALGVLAFNFYWWQAGVVLPLAIPLLMIGLIYLIEMSYGYFVEARAKRQITGIFGTYVPRELVAEMAKNPASYTTQGESRDMTVLFSDVRNFTTISEGLSPKDLTALMNFYLSEMTQTIQEQRGTIDKYIGDAIMAFWGAPLEDDQHSEHGLRSALAMQKRLNELGPEFEKHGWPRLAIGVGLNCGIMSVGDMGSTFRRAYTVMGDAVNLGARLEGITKQYGVGILVSEHIVKNVPRGVFREIDWVRVKGKVEPIKIYEPIGWQGEVLDNQLDAIDAFHRFLEKYRMQDWEKALKILEQLQKDDPDNKTYKIYVERVAKLQETPPGTDWDGVYTFETK